MGVLLGAIADDFTGATDLCNTLVRRGMRTVQLIDVPRSGTEIPDAEALVVALKSRTVPAAEAIDKSLAALGWLQQAGARQILFKYCSTFDFDRRRQYRPGRRGADGGARDRFHPVLPGISGGRPHDLQGLSLCWRRVAVGIGDARPPADADARSLSGAGAAAAKPRQSRTGTVGDRHPRCRRDRRRLCIAAPRRFRARHCRCDRRP